MQRNLLSYFFPPKIFVLQLEMISSSSGNSRKCNGLPHVQLSSSGPQPSFGAFVEQCTLFHSNVKNQRPQESQTQTQIVKCLCCCGSRIHVKNSENMLTFTTNTEARKTVNLPRQLQQMPKKLQLWKPHYVSRRCPEEGTKQKIGFQVPCPPTRWKTSKECSSWVVKKAA